MFPYSTTLKWRYFRIMAMLGAAVLIVTVTRLHLLKPTEAEEPSNQVSFNLKQDVIQGLEAKDDIVFPRYNPINLDEVGPMELTSPVLNVEATHSTDSPRQSSPSNSVNTTCIFPELDPFDPSITKFFPAVKPVECHGLPAITYVQNTVLRFVDQTKMLKLIGQTAIPTCQYLVVLQDPETTVLYKTTPWKGPLEDGHVFGAEEEHVHVQCHDASSNLIAEAYHLIIQVHPKGEAIRDGLFRHHVLKNNPVEKLNVLLLGIDSTSRMNYIRTLPKTRQLLKSMGGVELKKYNKVGDNTVPNLTVLLTGLYIQEQIKHWKITEPMDGWNFLWKDFQRAGYRTLYVEDFVNKWDDHVFHSKLHKGFSKRPTLYCTRPFNSYIRLTRNRSLDEPQCIGATPEIDITLGYTRQFIDTFKNKPYFALIWLWRFSHKDPSQTRAADLKYFNFIQGLYDDQRLNNTLLIFFSDHGVRYGSFRSSFHGMIEERAPFVNIVFPRWFQDKYPDIMRTLHTNTQRLATPFDFHETILDVLNFNGQTGQGFLNVRGISLFREIPKDRTCENAEVDNHWCLCKTMSPPGSIAEETRLYLARVLLLNVNLIVKPKEEFCIRFQLVEIISVIKQTIQDGRDQAQIRDGSTSASSSAFAVSIRASPGDAIFEGTLIQGADQQATVKGQISRLSAYAGQSDCMGSDIVLKLYCYCRNSHKGTNDTAGLGVDLL